MATGRTISASFLTDLDHRVIELCEPISLSIYNSIPMDEFKAEQKQTSAKNSSALDISEFYFSKSFKFIKAVSVGIIRIFPSLISLCPW